jgi:hypothetical protein
MNRYARYLGARKFRPWLPPRRKDRHAELLNLAAASRRHAATRTRIADAPDAAAWIASSGGYGSRDAYIATARAYLEKALIERFGEGRRLP